MLSEIGGTSGQENGVKLAYKLVDFLFKPEVLINYTWTGISRDKKGKKLSLQLLGEFIEIFYRVILKADNRHTREKNNNIFKDGILKHEKKKKSSKTVSLLFIVL